MFCNNCGAQIPNTSKFCPCCGTGVQATDSYQNTAKAARKPKCGKKGMLIAVGIVAVLAVLAVLVVNKMTQLRKEADPAKTPAVTVSKQTKMNEEEETAQEEEVAAEEEEVAAEEEEVAAEEEETVRPVDSEIWYDVDGEQLYIVFYEYNDAGQVIREETQEEDYWSVISYEYDEDGNIVSSTRKTPNGISYSFRFVYHFHEGQIYLRSQYNWDSLLYEWHYYYENGKIVKMKQVSKIDEETRWDVFDYDDKGRLLKETFTDSNGEILSLYEYEYDDSGRILTETTKLEKYVYEYDKDGLLIGKTKYDLDGNKTGYCECCYED